MLASGPRTHNFDSDYDIYKDVSLKACPDKIGDLLYCQVLHLNMYTCIVRMGNECPIIIVFQSHLTNAHFAFHLY